MTLKTLVSGSDRQPSAALAAAAATGVTSIAVRVRRPPPRRYSPSCGTSRCRRRRRPTCRVRRWLRRSPALAGPGVSFAGPRAIYIQGGIGRIEGRIRRREVARSAGQGRTSAVVRVSRHRPERPGRHRQRHRDGPERRRPTQNITFVPGPSPSGWQISQALARWRCCRCRLGRTMRSTPRRSPGRRHRRGGARAVRMWCGQPPGGRRAVRHLRAPSTRCTAGAAPAAPLPAPEALTDVIGRLADPAIPGSTNSGWSSRHRGRCGGARHFRTGACRTMASCR